MFEDAARAMEVGVQYYDDATGGWRVIRGRCCVPGSVRYCDIFTSSVANQLLAFLMCSFLPLLEHIAVHSAYGKQLQSC